MRTLGDIPKTMASLQDIIEVSQENEIEPSCDLAALDLGIMIEFENRYGKFNRRTKRTLAPMFVIY